MPYGATNPFCPRLNDTGVGNSLLVSQSVNSRVLATNAVTTVKIANFKITTAKLATSAVTTAKIANNAVTAGKVLAGAITNAKLGANAVTAAKINANAVTNAKILNAIIGMGNANSGSTAGKLNGIYKTFITNVSNTAVLVTHGLGRTPVGYFVFAPNKAGVVYRGSTNYLRASHVVIKSTLATVAGTMIVW